MPVNQINLGQHAGKIAKALDFGTVNQELRAKPKDGVLMLYSAPRAKGLGKVMQNLFANRKQKLANAEALLQQRLAHLEPAVRDAALQHTRWQTPSTENYRKVFQSVAAHDELPSHFRDFLGSSGAALITPELRQFAAARMLDDDLDFTVSLHGLKDMKPRAAQALAAAIMVKMAPETPAHNIKGDSIMKAARDFGISDKTTMRNMSEAQWRSSMADMTGPQLADILSSFLSEMTTDLQKNCYLPFLRDWKQS